MRPRWLSRFLPVALGLFLLACMFGLVTVPAASADDTDEPVVLTITGPGVDNSLEFTMAELEEMEQYRQLYSTINTWPTKKWYVAEGVKVRELLELAGINNEATLIKFSAGDGYSATFRVEELMEDTHYLFPHFKEGGGDADGHIRGDDSGAVEVEPILALKSANSDNFGDLNTRDAPHLIVGQRSVTEQTNHCFVKRVALIEVLTDPVPKWENPQANPGSGTVSAGTLVELSTSDMNWDKIHYTLDGSTPTMDSPMYNPIAKQWWFSRGAKAVAEINAPIEITEDTIIKAVAIGIGKEDSDVVEFNYTVAEGPVIFTVTGDVAGGERGYTLDQLLALEETTAQYSYTSGGQLITDECTGVLLADLLADAGITDPAAEVSIVTTDGYSHESYRVTLQEVIDDHYLVTYLINGEPFEDISKDGESSSTIRIYRNYNDGSGWLNRLTLIAGVEVADSGVSPTDWTLQLSGAKDETVTKEYFEQALACHPSHRVSWEDENGDVWGGMPLWLLVAMVDDDPDAGSAHFNFNEALAEQGYSINLIAGDGYSVTIESTDIIRNNGYIVANTLNGEPLPMQTDSGKPSWPLHLKGSAVSGSKQVGNIAGIELIGLPEPPEDPSISEVRIVKYGEDGTTVLAEMTVDYQWMEENLPVIGDGTKVYRFQGITNDPNNIWDPEETHLGGFKIANAVKGTRLMDLCELVGGMGAGTEIVLVARDGYETRLPYSSIYPDPSVQKRQGDAILAWWADGEYVPNYKDGMRLFFTPDDGVYSQWDMHETLPEQYWHYYYGDGVQYPSCAGLSAKYITEIRVYSIPQSDWTLELDGRDIGGLKYDVSKTYFEQALVCQFGANHKATYTDSKGRTWEGMPLWLLAGFVDDNDMHSDNAFNDELAGAGYLVKITAADGYSVTIDSTDIIRNSDYIIANTLNGAPIPDADKDWPLRLVGPAVSGSKSIGGIASIELLTLETEPVPVTGVSIAQGSQELEEGETVQLTAVVEPADATNKAVTWTSNNEAVAVVSATGLVTVVGAGTATITVTTVDGNHTDSVTVIVEDAVGISLQLSQDTASAGEKVTAFGKTSPDAWVPIKILDETQSIVVFDAQKADADGNYSIDFIIPDGVFGVLTVVVGEGSSVATATVTVTSDDDKAELRAKINEALELKEEAYTPDSWSALQSSLRIAQIILNLENAAQAAIDQSLARLSTAMEQLVETADKTALETAINEARALNPADYTARSWRQVSNMLLLAEGVLRDANAEQSEVDQAAERLNTALNALVEN